MAPRTPHCNYDTIRFLQVGALPPSIEGRAAYIVERATSRSDSQWAHEFETDRRLVAWMTIRFRIIYDAARSVGGKPAAMIA